MKKVDGQNCSFVYFNNLCPETAGRKTEGSEPKNSKHFLIESAFNLLGQFPYI
jgi:hypothetical protein